MQTSGLINCAIVIAVMDFLIPTKSPSICPKYYHKTAACLALPLKSILLSFVICMPSPCVSLKNKERTCLNFSLLLVVHYQQDEKKGHWISLN